MVKSFTIGGVTYNAVMASAVDQDKLLSMLTGAIMERSLVAARAGQDLDNAILVPMFMAMPSVAKVQIAEILIARVAVNGTKDQRVTLDDFSGKMVQYNTLLAELLRWNLSDFFDWLPSVLKDDQAASQESGRQ